MAGLVVLMVEAIAAYFLVLAAHAQRRRVGLAYFYAVLGGLTAVMSWVTDAGVSIQVGGVSFLVGSAVFFTALLLGVFVVYVFDGPRAARIAITTVVVVSALVPLIGLVLHLQDRLAGEVMRIGGVPMPSLRINVASVVATLADLVFLAVAWEMFGKPRPRIPLWVRSYLTLLGVMVLDVGIFATGAFAGSPEYLAILTGTLSSRLAISVFAFPFLYAYLHWQQALPGVEIEQRPVFAILTTIDEVRAELTSAEREIARRREVERDLLQALAEVKTLRGFLPICASCKKIRDDEGYWQQIESYVEAHSEAVFSHGLCPECLPRYFPPSDRPARRADDGKLGSSPAPLADPG